MGAPLTRDELRSSVNTAMPDQLSQAVSVADVRLRLHELIDSNANLAEGDVVPAVNALPKSGGTMTGTLILAGDAVTDLEPVTRRVFAQAASAEKVNIVRDRGADPTGNVAINAAFTASLGDLSPTRGGEIRFPEGIYKVGAALTVDQPYVTLRGRGRSSVIKRTTPEAYTLLFGGNATEGNRVMAPRVADLHFDGSSLVDSNDGYALLKFQYTDGAIAERVSGQDGSSLIRVGRGDLAWPLASQRCFNTTIAHCEAANMAYFGVELHGHKKTHVHHVKVLGGARSTSSEAAGIRSVKGENAQIDHVLIDGMGRGLLMTGGVDDIQADIAFDHIEIRNPTHGSCIDFSSPFRRLTLDHIKAMGSGPNQPSVVRINPDTGLELVIDRLYAEASSALCTELLRIDNIAGVDVAAFIGRHIGYNPSVSHYGILLVGCDGLAVISRPRIEMDDADNARGIRDSGGLATLSLYILNSLFSLAAANRVNAVTPSGSSAVTVVQNPLLAGVPPYQVVSTDADFTLTPFASPLVTYVTGALAATRAVTLATTNAYAGLTWTVVHRGSGASLALGTGPLKTMPPNSWARVEYAGGFVLREYGTL